MNECSEFEEKRKTAYIKSGMGDIDWRYHWHSYGNKTIILDIITSCAVCGKRRSRGFV